MSTFAEKAGGDPALHAYLVKRWCREEPRTALSKPEELAGILAEVTTAATQEIVRGLARQEIPGVTPFLTHLIAADPRWVVQVTAAEELGRRCNESSALECLLGSLSSNTHPHLQAAILSALGKNKADVPVKLIKPFLVHQDARIRASAIEALLARNLDGLASAFALLINDTSPRVKALAAVGLWRLGNPILLDLLRDAEQVDHRLSYLYALGLTGPNGRSRQYLLEVLQRNRVAERAMACRSLRTVADREDIPALLELARDATGRETREEIAGTCRGIDQARSHEGIHDLLAEAGHARNARHAASCLSLLSVASGSPDVNQVAGFLKYPDARVRANAVEALAGSPRLADVLPQVLRSFDTSAPRVKANAAVCLWSQGYQMVIAQLRQLSAASAAGGRASAAWALGKIGTLVASPILEGLLDDADEGVRIQAIRGLGGV